MSATAEAAALPAASLLLASIALLFSAWYGELRDAIDAPRPAAVDAQTTWARDRIIQRNARALPLIVALVAFLVVFAPDVTTVVVDAANRLFDPDRWDDYEATGAALIVLWLFAAALLVHLVRLRRDLRGDGPT